MIDFVIALVIGLIISFLIVYFAITLSSVDSNGDGSGGSGSTGGVTGSTGVFTDCTIYDLSSFIPSTIPLVPISTSKPIYTVDPNGSPIIPDCIASSLYYGNGPTGSYPLPTNRWVTSSLVSDVSTTIDSGTSSDISSLLIGSPSLVYPYNVTVMDGGLLFNYPTSLGSTANINGQLIYNIEPGSNVFIGSANLANGATGATGSYMIDMNSKLAYFDELSATYVYIPTGSRDLISNMTVPLVQGSPYLTFIYSSLTPLLSSFIPTDTLRATWSIEPNDGRLHSKYELTSVSTINGVEVTQIYHILANPGISFTLLGSFQLVSSSVYNGYLRIFCETDINQSTLLLDDSYWMCYPKAVQPSLYESGITGDTGGTGYINFDWSYLTQGQGSLISLALPHQTNLEGVDDTGITINHPLLGNGRYVVGKNWHMPSSIINSDIVPSVSIELDPYFTELTQQWQIDMGRFVVAPSIPSSQADFDNAVRQLQGWANLLIVGEKINLTSSPLFLQGLDQLINQVNSIIAASTLRLTFDTNWSGLIVAYGIPTSTTNSGNIYYNVHQVQYGYILYTLAVISRYQLSYVNTNISLVMSLIRDVVNPSKSDPWFTTWRNKDWYLGHSIDTGLIDSSNGRVQQSVTESINCYFAICVLGKNLGSGNMVEVGQALLTSEIRALQTYYQVDPALFTPNSMFDQVKTINLLSNLGYQYAPYSNMPSNVNTFPASNAPFIATEFLPITNVTQVAISKTWLTSVSGNIQNAIDSGQLSDGWKAYAYMMLAYNGQSSTYWDSVRSLNDQQMILGNTLTYSMYWLLLQMVLQQ